MLHAHLLQEQPMTSPTLLDLARELIAAIADPADLRKRPDSSLEEMADLGKRASATQNALCLGIYIGIYHANEAAIIKESLLRLLAENAGMTVEQAEVKIQRQADLWMNDVVDLCARRS
jgi:hypothetical protein